MANERDHRVMNPNKGGLDTLMHSMTGAQSVERIVEVVPENALVRREDGAMTYKRFVIWPIGLQVPDDVTGDELEDVGRVLNQLSSSIQWNVGDWLNAAEHVWGESYQAVAVNLGYAIKTIYEWASVCRKVSIRMETLSFGHHQVVASHNEEDQRKWLGWAASQGWTIAQMREEIRKSTTVIVGTPMLLPGFNALEIKSRRKRETRLTAWQDGTLSLSPTEALDEINGLIEYWTTQRESLIEQVSDRDKTDYQE